ncbi:cobyric acid synthase [Clostridium zeae]|uniref:Cobyric acid synthase n=1 Tax=Clostridium zeae TaxID=2759022 RepID=A0ABQ1ED24_9CLOT|nr:cobyric acid synthase [Clostridium zeae]GFZ32651.1 cobyric acid synthase [Clostridium zeae]
MAKIMIQGTASSVGKSILVAALCRIFKQDGFKVVPFKSQNMSLNSYITLDGKEMGRAQVLQAYACGLEPEVYMNPILLKPTSDKKSQVIVNGKVFGNYTAMEYHNMKAGFKDMLKKHFDKLEEDFDIVVIEGAGSPAEINLRDKDIVNMGMAELVDAPVLLVGDIDKGGVFAALAGTMLLLKEDEKKRVEGTIINKFRGDVKILEPGLDMLEEIIDKPTLGVIPYFKLKLEDEDGAVDFNKKVTAPIDVAVIKLPRISNFTDLDALKNEEDVSVRFITSPEEFGTPDLLIIPGSKNTIEDLKALRENGLEDKVITYSKSGMVIGICGGYQMLGKSIEDPYEVETELREINGMGLLDIGTVFEKEKVTTRVRANVVSEFFGKDKTPDNGGNELEQIYGYEIHMGISSYGTEVEPLFEIVEKNGQYLGEQQLIYKDGAININGNIMGTYIHGIFDGCLFREYIINKLREKKGLSYKKASNYESLRESELDKLADIVRNSLDMNKIYEIVGLEKEL